MNRITELATKIMEVLNRENATDKEKSAALEVAQVMNNFEAAENFVNSLPLRQTRSSSDSE